MEDAAAKSVSPLNVLTATDRARRWAVVGTNAIGLGLMAIIIAPYAAANAGLFLAAAFTYSAVRAVRKLITRYNEPTERHSGSDDVPEHATRAVAHFAELAGISTPSVVRLSAPSTFAQATANTGYVTPRVGFTTALEREYDRLAFTAFLAHEVGHITHDNQKLDAASAVMLFSGRTLRWAMVAGVAAGSLPLTPVIAGAAILTPLLMHMAHKSNSRQKELINDRFAAVAMGTPTPIARAFALHGRAVRQGKLVGKFAPPLPDASGTRENNFERALRWIEIAENFGPVATHPSAETRRKALANLRRNGQLTPRDSQSKALRAMLD